MIYCAETHRLGVDFGDVITSEDKTIISFLLPASALNGTISYTPELVPDPENTLFEVSCQVLNVTIFPYHDPNMGVIDGTIHLLSN